MRIVSPDAVRSAIASYLLGGNATESLLGTVTLHAHQRVGASRLARLLESHGGAVLADDVGLGKTFAALAVARHFPSVTVYAPAALRAVWMDAQARTQVGFRFFSLESLSRGVVDRGGASLVVIDEAHHLRNRRTRRHQNAARACADAHVLLLSATPVQNRLDDLRALVSLFLGDRAYAFTELQLGQFVVRRFADELERAGVGLPAVHAPRWLPAIDDVDCLERIQALPAPVPPVDGGVAGALLTYTLARQWASSRAALRAAIERRLARGRAMEDALVAGRAPTHAELRAWAYADGAQQLALPLLAVAQEARASTHLLDQVRLHCDALRELLALLRASPDPDIGRAARLRELLTASPGRRIVAFTEFADTVRALYTLLAPRGNVAMLTHAGGRVAGGVVSRGALLAQFANDAVAVASHERVDLLLSTDVLSEGVNLPAADTVVHLDLAWNPARLAQRVGRLRRLGAGPHSIGVFAFAPPAPAERLLALEQRLRLKLGIAARSVGVVGTIIPQTTGVAPASPEQPAWERVYAMLEHWRSANPPREPVAAAVRAPVEGALACVRHHGAASLVAITQSGISASPAEIGALLHARGAPAPLAASELARVVDRVRAWLRAQETAEVVDLPAIRAGSGRRFVLRRVDAIALRAPRHARAALAPLIGAARSVASVSLTAGAERVLDELAAAPLDDRAWLSAVGEFAAIHARGGDSPAEILALLVLRATSADSGG